MGENQKKSSQFYPEKQENDEDYADSELMNSQFFKTGGSQIAAEFSQLKLQRIRSRIEEPAELEVKSAESDLDSSRLAELERESP